MITQSSDPFLRLCCISKHNSLVKILSPVCAMYLHAVIPKLYVHDLTYQLSLLNDRFL